MMERRIRVTGRATVDTPADIVVVRLDIEGMEGTYEGAIRRCAENGRDIKDRLEAVGLDRDSLKTVSQNVRPHSTEVRVGKDANDRWITEKRLDGFEYTNTLRFEFLHDNEVLGRIMASVLQSPCHPSVTILFRSSDAESARAKALGLAVEDARAKAEVISKSLGCSLGQVIDVSYDSRRQYCDEREFLSADCNTVAIMGSSLDMDVDPEDRSFSEEVTTVWSLHQIHVGQYQIHSTLDAYWAGVHDQVIVRRIGPSPSCVSQIVLLPGPVLRGYTGVGILLRYPVPVR